MENFEEEVNYFINVVFNNIQVAKSKRSKNSQEEALIHNLNIKLDGQEIIVWNTEKDYPYEIYTKDIKEYKFKYDITKYLALTYIEKLTKYLNKEITFEELAEIQKETNPVVKKIIKKKQNISEQLKLLRTNRNIPEVQQYIEELYNNKYTSEYVKYLIDKYYYNKKNLVKPEKNALERMNKLLLK